MFFGKSVAPKIKTKDGRSARRRWSDEEGEIVRENLHKKSYKEIALLLESRTG